MATMILRGIDEKTATVLKEKAGKEGTSVNALMLRIVREALGIERKKRCVEYDDLDHLAGELETARRRLKEIRNAHT